jgi:hypothetical protein
VARAFSRLLPGPTEAKHWPTSCVSISHYQRPSRETFRRHHHVASAITRNIFTNHGPTDCLSVSCTRWPTSPNIARRTRQWDQTCIFHNHDHDINPQDNRDQFRAGTRHPTAVAYSESQSVLVCRSYHSHQQSIWICSPAVSISTRDQCFAAACAD